MWLLAWSHNFVIDQHIPVEKKSVQSKDVPFMTKKWKKETRDKWKSAKAYANNKTEENWEMRLQNNEILLLKNFFK